jgi:hypothetical protein
MVVMIIGLSMLAITFTGLTVYYLRSRSHPFLPPLTSHPSREPQMTSVLLGPTQTKSLLAEDEFQTRALFWDRPNIDSTFHATDALRAFKQVEGIGSIGTMPVNKISRFGIRTPRETQQILEQFWDESDGAFKQWRYGWAESYSVDAAFRFIEELTNYSYEDDRKTTIKQLFGRWLKSSCKFLEECWDEESGIYSDTPYGAKASLTTTFAVASAMEALDTMGVRDSSICATEAIRLDIEKMMANHARKEHASFAFSNTKYGNGLLCTTFYALKILHYFARNEFNSLIDPKGVLRFVDFCWSKDTGGYSQAPGIKPTLIHTRYALSAMHFLLEKHFVDSSEVRNILNPVAVLDYVITCQARDGFGVARELAPSVLGARLAVKVVKLLYQIEYIMGDKFPRTPEYASKMGLLYQKKDSVKQFIESCKERGTLNYTGFPPIILSKTPSLMADQVIYSVT